MRRECGANAAPALFEGAGPQLEYRLHRLHLRRKQRQLLRIGKHGLEIGGTKGARQS